MIYPISQPIQQRVAIPINLRCPACRHNAALTPIGQDHMAATSVESGSVLWGARMCPNPDCRALLLFTAAGNEITAYPPETIDFDATNLPVPVVAALEEAIKCHAQKCYMAAAIMVRKTLEQVCADQGATGNNLYERIENLQQKATLPTAMLSALHDLRLLGNDAAHVELSDFDDVGDKEVEVALGVAKEILKAVYQYESIMQELASLKKNSA